MSAAILDLFGCGTKLFYSPAVPFPHLDSACRKSRVLLWDTTSPEPDTSIPNGPAKSDEDQLTCQEDYRSARKNICIISKVALGRVFLRSEKKTLVLSSGDSSPMKEPPVSSSHFSSSDIAQIVELNITVEPTLAAAAMHMSASDEPFSLAATATTARRAFTETWSGRSLTDEHVKKVANRTQLTVKKHIPKPRVQITPPSPNVATANNCRQRAALPYAHTCTEQHESVKGSKRLSKDYKSQHSACHVCRRKGLKSHQPLRTFLLLLNWPEPLAHKTSEKTVQGGEMGVEIDTTTPILPLTGRSDLAVAGCLENYVDIGSKL
ncbi:hypothetical protein D9C73_024051 [Collichthys lucidus]|uniref:Uncharacterized protein n=1 Tax=Collichthys lucidus TaxID=240159 RepID=A0A4V6ATU0_COLLU|nr:hypothetical protein D9C73_024051 [Collichthys lucidus]